MASLVQRAIGVAQADGGLLINDVVFAEMSVRFHTLEEAVRFAETLGLVLLAISREALFNAGKAFQAYRWAGGGKENVLPDFFVGAHALELAVPLLTRDPKVYRTYFPTLELITP